MGRKSRGKETRMGHKHMGRGTLPPWVGGLVLLATVLCASAIPGYTWRGGGHRGGGHGIPWRTWGPWGAWVLSTTRAGSGSTSAWGLLGGRMTLSMAIPIVIPPTYAPQIAVQPAPPVVLQAPSLPPAAFFCDNPRAPNRMSPSVLGAGARWLRPLNNRGEDGTPSGQGFFFFFYIKKKNTACPLGPP